jgi:hypothetical protein
MQLMLWRSPVEYYSSSETDDHSQRHSHERNLMLSNLRIRHRAKGTESTLGRAFAPVWGSMARHLTMLVAGYPPRIEEFVTVGAAVDHTEGYSGFLVCAGSEGISSLLSGLGEFRGCRIYPNRN